MEKKKNNLLIVLGGAIACFVAIGLIYMYTSSKTNNLKGNDLSMPNHLIDIDKIKDIGSDDVSLGDDCTSCIDYCMASSGHSYSECRSSCSSSCSSTSSSVYCYILSNSCKGKTITGKSTCNSSNGEYSSKTTCQSNATPTPKPKKYCYDANDGCNRKEVTASSCSSSLKLYDDKDVCQGHLPTPTPTSTPTPTPAPTSPTCSQPCCINGVTVTENSPCQASMPAGTRTCGQCPASVTATPKPTSTPTPTADTRVTCWHQKGSSQECESGKYTTCANDPELYTSQPECLSHLPNPTTAPTAAPTCLYTNQSKCETTEGSKCAKGSDGCWAPVSSTPTPTPTPAPKGACCCNSNKTSCSMLPNQTTCQSNTQTLVGTGLTAAQCSAKQVAVSTCCVKGSIQYNTASDCQHAEAAGVPVVAGECTKKLAKVVVNRSKVYPTPNKTVNVSFSAYDEDGSPIAVDWSTSGYSLITKNCSGKQTICNVTISSNQCGGYTLNGIGSLNGVSKSASVSMVVYVAWSGPTQKTSNKAVSERSRDAMKLIEGCEAIENVKKQSDGTYTYDSYWRCCGGGGSSSSKTPTPAPNKYDYCCVNKSTNKYSWKENQSSESCPNGYEIDRTKTSRSSCSPSTPEKVPYCYVDSDNKYYWTSEPESSWRIVEGITKEADCKPDEEQQPACYKSSTGEYLWGTYAKTDGFTLITSILTAEDCKTPTPDYACYKNKYDDYVWDVKAPDECEQENSCWVSKTAGNPNPDTCPYDTKDKCEEEEGYKKLSSITLPEDCIAPQNYACYLHGSEFVWGTYDNKTGYIKLEDITSESECKAPTSACYENSDGDYVWGDYAGDSSYKLIPSVTSESQCNNDVPTPSTGSSISKIVYIFMAVLMAFGIGFIYYSSVMKKNNQ